MITEKKGPFCLIPFGQLSSKPDGKLRPCCPSGDQLLLKEKSLLEAWRSEEMNSLRRSFLRGDSVPGCWSCLEDEELGNKSVRLWKNESWEKITQKNVSIARLNDGKINDALPICLELRLGNICNLSCRMCNPLFSSRFQKDLERDESWRSSPLLRGLYESTLKDSRKLGNWYQEESFWHEAVSMSANLRSLYFSGGEPLLIEEMQILLRHLVKVDQAKKVKVRLNTNLMQVPPAIFDLLKHFKEVDIGVSLDAVGNLLEKIRYGSKWSKIKEHLFQVVEMGKPFKISISALASAMNACEIDDLYFFIKRELDKDIVINLDLLKEPRTLSAKCLSEKEKRTAIEKVNRIKDELRDELSTYELGGLHSLEQVLNQESEVTTKEYEEHQAFLDLLHNHNP